MALGEKEEGEENLEERVVEMRSDVRLVAIGEMQLERDIFYLV